MEAARVVGAHAADRAPLGLRGDRRVDRRVVGGGHAYQARRGRRPGSPRSCQVIARRSGEALDGRGELRGDHHDVGAGREQPGDPALRRPGRRRPRPPGGRPAAGPSGYGWAVGRSRGTCSGVIRSLLARPRPAASNVATSRRTPRRRRSAPAAAPAARRCPRRAAGRGRPAGAGPAWSARAWPGSALRCPAMQAATTSGGERLGDQRGRAGDHAVEDHRVRSAAAPSRNPTIAACSRPPTAARTPSGSRRVRPVQLQRRGGRPRPCGRRSRRRCRCRGR